MDQIQGLIVNLIRRYGLFFYWLVFAAYVAREGAHAVPLPGREQLGYQWNDTFVVWIALALAVYKLHRIIDPKNYRASTPRFGKAFGFSLLLIPLSLVFFGGRGMPKVMDIPLYFALVTTGLMLVCAAAETIVFEFQKRQLRH